MKKFQKLKKAAIVGPQKDRHQLGQPLSKQHTKVLSIAPTEIPIYEIVTQME